MDFAAAGEIYGDDSSTTSQNLRGLACPFFKKDPRAYQYCGGYSFAHTPDVRIHITLAHKRQVSCPRCFCALKTNDGKVEYSSQVEHSTHCNFPVPLLGGVTEGQDIQLARVTSMSNDRLEQWFTIFDILFARHEPRPDPFAPVKWMHADSRNLWPPESALLAFESNVGPNTIIPKRLKSGPAYCTECDDHPNGFRGDSELRRHRDRRHKVMVKKWICIQPSGPDHLEPVYPLSKCKACRQQQKRYNAYYNAAAHLRRVHFCPKRRVRGMSKREVDGVNERDRKAARNWPAMSELKHWMVEVEEQTTNLEGICSGDEAEISDNNVVESDDQFAPLSITSSWDRTYSLLYGSPISTVSMESRDTSSKRGEPESVEVESVVPFTDSGYKSAPNVGYPPVDQANPKQSPCPPKKVPEMGRNEVEDTRTQYSIGSTVDPVNARKCIVDIASDMFGKLQLNGVGPKNRTVFSQVLPDLIKAFAFKICDDRDSQENRELMHFIHKRHR
jgi:hypothetical protein